MKDKYEHLRITAEKKIKTELPQEMYDPGENIKSDLVVGSWIIKKSGDMEFNNGKNHYDIEAKRLTEDDWIIHLFSKGWVDFNEFIPAYFHALRNVGKEFIKIKIFY